MRRHPAIGASFVPLLVALARPAGGADFPEIQKRGVLRVVTMLDARQPEFFSTEPGVAPGFDHEVLEGFMTLHRIKMEVVPVAAWDLLIPTLLEGKGDVIAGRFTDTEARRKRIDFTAEVFPTRHLVVTRKPHRVIHTLEELRAERVGTIKGTSLAEAVAAAGVPPANVDDGIPVGGIADALRSGRITAAIWGVETAVAAQQKDPHLQFGLFVGPPGRLAYGVRKDAPKLREALNEYIQNLRRTPTWHRLVVKYFGGAAPEVLKKARAQ